MSYIKIAIYAVPLIFGLIVGYYLNDIKLEKLNRELKIKTAECETARQANESNIKTIEALKKEIAHRDTLCNERLRNCKKVQTRIEYIESLRDCKKDEEQKNHVVNHDDPVLIELSGLWSVKSGN